MSIKGSLKHTVSEERVFGTAIKSSGSEFEAEDEGGSWEAKEQKFMVFTCRICKIHG